MDAQQEPACYLFGRRCVAQSPHGLIDGRLVVVQHGAHQLVGRQCEVAGTRHALDYQLQLEQCHGDIGGRPGGGKRAFLALRNETFRHEYGVAQPR